MKKLIFAACVCMAYCAQAQDNGLSTSNPSGMIAFGQNAGALGAPASLVNDREIPMRRRNILFSQDGRIGIGNLFTAAAILPTAKVDIRATAGDPMGIFVENANFMSNIIYQMNMFSNIAIGTSENWGLNVVAAGDPTKRAVGINIEASAPNADNTGIITSAFNGPYTNQGGNFNASGLNSTNTGVVGNANSSVNTNIGASFQAGNPSYVPNGYNGIGNTAVSGVAFGGQVATGVYGNAIGGSSANYAGYFDGDVYANGGAFSGTGYFVASDKRLKKDIKKMEQATGLVMKLNPTTYNMDGQFVPQLAMDKDNLQYGLIAQELETVFPGLVKEVTIAAQRDEKGKELFPAKKIKSVNYTGLIPVLIRSIQEQQETISSQSKTNDAMNQQLATQQQQMADQQKQIDELKALVNANSTALRTGATTGVSAANVSLSDKNTIVLNQNVPNPFAESTSISYNIPTSFKYAQILFYAADGRIIKTVDIKETGQGKINVFANDLSNGLYTYSLVIDGKVIDSKKMVKQD